MAAIEIKFDNQLEQAPIVVPLMTPTEEQDGGQKNFTGGNVPIQQTQTYGVLVPLVRVGDIVVDIDDVIYMKLDGTGRLPKLQLTVADPMMKIRGLQNPTTDSEVRLQIIPRFENAYKKIDLTFYIKKFDVDGDEINLSCIYKVLPLYSSRLKCFGEINTYDVFEQIATDCKLGFASNVAEGCNDTRYIYCANESYIDLMAKIIRSSGESGNDITSTLMYDYWVDFWNNLNIVDIYERFNTVDPDDSMLIWVSGSPADNAPNNKDEENYFQSVACITNSPTAIGSELYTDHYNPTVKASTTSSGTDRVISTYSMTNNEALDYLLQKGDQQYDVVEKYEYLGECYRDYDYLLSENCHDMMYDNMVSEVLEVKVSSPLIALMRGSKVNMLWYNTDDNLHQTKMKLNIKESDIQTNIPTPEQQNADEDYHAAFRLDNQITGQYYILSSVIIFEDRTWSNTLRLTRPRVNKMQFLDLKEAYKNV